MLVARAAAREESSPANDEHVRDLVSAEFVESANSNRSSSADFVYELVFRQSIRQSNNDGIVLFPFSLPL